MKAKRRLAWLSGLLAVVGFVRLATFQGLWRPVRIDGGSMAETLLGPHFELTCEECGHVFRFGVEHPPLDDAVCPNCGFSKNSVDRASPRPGDQVLIDRAANWFSGPKRGAIVALQTPGDESEWAVKRVVGLPGETISIRRGELFVNDRPWQKSLAEFRELRVLVHDDRHRSRSSRRWSGAWTETPEGYEHADRSTDEFDWLVYQHRPCYAGAKRSDESPIQDNDAYNPSRSRTLFPVGDVQLECEVQLGHARRFAIEIDDGTTTYRAVYSDRGTRWRLERGSDSTPLAVATEHDEHARWWRLEFGGWDGRWWLVVDGREWIVAAAQPAGDERKFTSRPVRIGVVGQAAVRGLRIYRDVYFLDPYGQGAAWSSGQLGPEEYCVLGDNAPLSRDSRQWHPTGIPRRLILGSVRNLR